MDGCFLLVDFPVYTNKLFLIIYVHRLKIYDKQFSHIITMKSPVHNWQLLYKTYTIFSMIHNASTITKHIYQQLLINILDCGVSDFKCSFETMNIRFWDK